MSDNERQSGQQKQRDYIAAIALSGAAAALVFVSTLLSVPAGTGNLNMGDGMILLVAYVIGPIAFFPAAIGAALCDLALGYTVYIPATFFIKGLLGLSAGLIMLKGDPSIPRKTLAFVIAETIMAGGYFFFEWLLYGLNTAVGQLPANLIQGAVAIIIAFVLTLALGPVRRRIRMSLFGNN